MSNPEIPGPGPEETSLPHWYQFVLEAKERLQTQDSTILELTQKFEDMETRTCVDSVGLGDRRGDVEEECS
jgi:hypothetical protein